MCAYQLRGIEAFCVCYGCQDAAGRRHWSYICLTVERVEARRETFAIGKRFLYKLMPFLYIRVISINLCLLSEIDVSWSS